MNPSRREENGEDMTEAEILKELKAPIVSFRLFALEKAIQGGNSSELLGALRLREQDEDDEECRMLLRHAIPEVERRLSQTPRALSVPAAIIMSPERFEIMSAPERVAWLQAASNEPHDELKFLEKFLCNHEQDPFVIVTFIRVFGGKWPLKGLSEFSRLLFSPRLSVRLAILDLFSQRDPERVRAFLPRLLVSDDPRTRVLAIRGLARLDLDEAIRHLDFLLSRKDPHQRRAALDVSVFLPFDRIKLPLLQFLAQETQVELLQRAGLLIEHNPDPEIPFQLWEIAENSTKTKAPIIKEILQQSVQNLKRGNGVKGDFQDYVDSLQSWIQERSAQKFVQNSIEWLKEANPAVESEVLSMMKQALQKPHIREALEKALEWSLPEDIKGKLQALFSSATPPDGPSDGPPARLSDSLPLDEKIRLITLQTDAIPESVKPTLLEVLANPATPPDLRATSLRMAARVGIQEFVEPCKGWLRHENPNLVAGALEYLAQFDAEALTPYLGTFLQSQNLRLRGLAIKILRSLDAGQSLSALKAMLAKASATQAELALACLVHFDFAVIREVLTEFLEKNMQKSLFQAGLVLFLANPEPENLYSLFRLEKALPAEMASEARAARRQQEKQLEKYHRLPEGNKDTRERILEERWLTERKKQQAPPPPYAVRVLHPPTEGLSLGRLFEEWPFAWFLGPLILLLIAGIWWVLAPRNAPPHGVPSAGAIESRLFVLQGKMTEIDPVSGDIRVINQEGTSFLIIGLRGFQRPSQKDSTFSGEVKPFRVGPDGVVICKFIRLLP
jgi:HEAT repeat protein